MFNDTKKNVASPCIGVCVLDNNDLCEGCLRTAEEIGCWSMYSNEKKQAVVKLSWQRAKDAGKLL